MKVALFVNGWNAENVDNFIDGFNEFFSNGDTDLFVFTSYSGSVESIERNLFYVAFDSALDRGEAKRNKC